MGLYLPLKPSPHLRNAKARVEKHRQIERVNTLPVRTNGDHVLADVAFLTEYNGCGFLSRFSQRDVAAPESGFAFLRMTLGRDEDQPALFGKNLSNIG